MVDPSHFQENNELGLLYPEKLFIPFCIHLNVFRGGGGVVLKQSTLIIPYENRVQMGSWRSINGCCLSLTAAAAAATVVAAVAVALALNDTDTIIVLPVLRL